LRLRLIAVTPEVETITATAVLTTSSKRTPQEIYRSLRVRRDRVEKVLGGLMLKHGSVLEHNRLVFLAEADESEVLKLLLANRFFEVTPLGEGKWLISCCLRTAIATLTGGHELPEGVQEGLSEALRQTAPTLWRKVVERGG